MIEITEAMVKAGAAAICCQAQTLGCAAQNKDSEFNVCQMATYLKDAQHCLEAALAVAADEKRKACKHYRRVGTGYASSDGSGSYSWSCPDCGASDSYSTPARVLQERESPGK